MHLHVLGMANQPINLIGDAFKHAAPCKAHGIFRVPLLESSYFYPLIWNRRTFRSFIKEFRVINPRCHSTANTSVFKGYVDFKSF